MVHLRSDFPIHNGIRNIYLNEDTPIGTIIGSLSDPRPGEEGTMTPHYFLSEESSGYKPDNEYFTFDDNNNIFLNTALNYATKNSYNLSFNGTGVRDLALSMGGGTWNLEITVNDPNPLTHAGKFEDFLVKRMEGHYQIVRKETITRDGIVLPGGMESLLNGVENHKFDDVSINVLNHVKAVFDDITGLRTESAKMFRLFQAAFDRFPDASGFKYWVDNYISGRDSARVIASSFVESDEFKRRYGENTSNEKYVDTFAPNTYNVNVIETDTQGNSSSQYLIVNVNDSQELDVSNHVVGDEYELAYIRDYGGNLHANTGSLSDATKSAYKYQGLLDVNADSVNEAIYTNKESGRWVTASVDSITGEVDYSKHGSGGTTRVVGIYIDPLVASGDVVQGSDHDSQRRFQNDLKNDNLLVKASGDYEVNGTQEVYWKTFDGTAYLRALMHADGNIKYANYQSLYQMTNYLTSNGFADTVALIA